MNLLLLARYQPTALQRFLHTSLSLWIAAFAVAITVIYFVVRDAAPFLVSFSAKVYGPYWDTRFWMFAHVAVGTGSLLVGAGQIVLGVCRITGAMHRWLGRAYVACVLTSSLTVAALLANGSAIGPTFGILLAAITGISTVYVFLGWVSARRRDTRAHRTWMIRSYMTMTIFAFFRLVVELPVLLQMSVPERFTTLLAVTYFVIHAGTEIALEASGTRKTVTSLDHQYARSA